MRARKISCTKSFHPSLGIPLITTDGNAVAVFARSIPRFHPSLGIPLITTVKGGGNPSTLSEGFHPSLGIPLITTPWAGLRPPSFGAAFPSLFRDSSDHHPVAWGGVGVVRTKAFPSLFRDSSDHH